MARKVAIPTDRGDYVNELRTIAVHMDDILIPSTKLEAELKYRLQHLCYANTITVEPQSLHTYNITFCPEQARGASLLDEVVVAAVQAIEDDCKQALHNQEMLELMKGGTQDE